MVPGHIMSFTDRFNTRVMISQMYCIRKGYQRYGHIITAHIASLHYSHTGSVYNLQQLVLETASVLSSVI